jgi:hypothetical protein
MFVERSEQSRFWNLQDGEFFRFPGDKKTYQVISHREKTFCAISHIKIPIRAIDERAVVIRVVKMPVLSERSQRAFDAMKENMAITGKPGHYRDDLLIHDRGILAEHNPAQFGWMVRDTGTHFIRPNDTMSIFLMDYETGTVKRKMTPPHDYYWWNGERLTDVTMASMEERLMKISCPMARRFNRASSFSKGQGNITSQWQEQIDRELKGLPTLELSMT